MKPPCKDCPERAVNCRAECRLWKDYEAERNASYEQRRKYCDIAGYTANKQSKRKHREHISGRGVK
jgi:hypothetical protein